LEDSITNRLKKEWLEWLKIRSTGKIFVSGNDAGITYMLGHLLTTGVYVGISATFV